jgi:hypothetical protein
LETFSSSATILPLAPPVSMSSSTLPCTSRRCGVLPGASRQAWMRPAARAARLDALADPDFFLRQQLVEAGVEQRLVLQL